MDVREPRTRAMSRARSVEARLRDALQLPEAAMRFLELEALLGDIDQLRTAVMDERDRAAYHANLAGWSYGRLGSAIGKSKALGQQMVGRGRELEEEGDG